MTQFLLNAAIKTDVSEAKCLNPSPQTEGSFNLILRKVPDEDRQVHLFWDAFANNAKAQGGITGIRHAEAMLREQEKIPERWRGNDLIFPELWHWRLAPPRYILIRYDYAKSKWCLYWPSIDYPLSGNSQYVVAE